MEPEALRITGTFLNEISFDIPSQNWGPGEWADDFSAMQAIGIDTVIIIKGGLRKQTVFPSKVIGTHQQDDLAALFLEEAAKEKNNAEIQKRIHELFHFLENVEMIYG